MRAIEPIGPLQSCSRKLLIYSGPCQRSSCRRVLHSTEEVRSLSIASHFNKYSAPIVARFSVGGGIPHISDAENVATPKGLAVRFLVDEHIQTDLVSHTLSGFATRTGEGFLAFLRIFRAFQTTKTALDKATATGKDVTDETTALKAAAGPFEAFLINHPLAATFVNSPKPNPLDYGMVTYYEPNTHILTNAAGKVTNVRYRLDPADGEHLHPNDPEQLKELDKSYLEEGLHERFPDRPIVFNIQAHIANSDDVLDDSTVPYKSTTIVPIGN